MTDEEAEILARLMDTLGKQGVSGWCMTDLDILEGELARDVRLSSLRRDLERLGCDAYLIRGDLFCDGKDLQLIIKKKTPGHACQWHVSEFSEYLGCCPGPAFFSVAEAYAHFFHPGLKKVLKRLLEGDLVEGA